MQPLLGKLIRVSSPIVVFSLLAPTLAAGVVFGLDGDLGGGYRWDAAPRTIDGNERSLDGGLRYSLQGGSVEAYRDLFSWSGGTPSVSDFGQAIEQAFAAWTAVDPATGLGTNLYFVDDTLNTAVVGNGDFGSGINVDGAEIDLFGADAGDGGTRGVAEFAAVLGDVTLTSGTTGYGGAEGGGAISGADVYLNSNSGAEYTLDLFRRLLTHEIGHALGLGDVEDYFGNGFIDDNYDGSTSTTARETLTNSWALSVNVDDPSASAGLTKYAPGTVSTGDPGLNTSDVDILMEGDGLGIGSTNPLSNLFPLVNDDYGTRQFLYPFRAEAVPEPSTIVLAGVGLLACAVCRRRNAAVAR